MTTQNPIMSKEAELIDYSTSVRIAVLDASQRDRSDIYLQCSRQSVHSELYENFSELKTVWRRLSLILVHDEGDQLAKVAYWSVMSGNPLPIVAYAENPAIDQVVKAIKAGACDFLSQPFNASSIKRIVAQAVNEASQAAATRMRQQRAMCSVERLSPREREVLIALSDGLTSQQIAEKFGISPRTVEVHRYKLRRKLGSISTAQAIRLVVEGGLDCRAHA